MPTCFGGYALLFSNIAELGWIYFYLDVQRRHRMQRALGERAAGRAGVLGLNGRPQGQGCHHPSLNLAGHDASVGRGLAREGHRVHDRR